MIKGLEVYYRMVLELDQLYSRRNILDNEEDFFDDLEKEDTIQKFLTDECNNILDSYVTSHSTNKFGYGVASYVKLFDVNVFLDFDYYSFDIIVKNFDNLFKYANLIREMLYIMTKVDYIAKICFNNNYGMPRTKPWNFNHICIYGPDIRGSCKYDSNGNEIYKDNELFYPKNLSSLLGLMDALRAYKLRPRLHVTYL